MLSKARATLIAAVLTAGAAAAVAQAAPQIHAHRGGTVVNGKPTFTEESLDAYRHAARDGFVLEVDAKLTKDGVPVALHDATLDRTTTCTGELRTVHARRPARLQARRARQPRRRPRHPQRVAARLDRDDRRGARARPPDRGQGQPRDQERPDRPRLRPDARLREPGHGRRDRLGPAALAAAHPELHPREPRRGQAAPARRGDQPADLQLGPERHRPRRLVRLQVAVAAVAARRRLRGRRPPRPASRRPLHPQQARRRPRRRTGEGRRADHRRPLDGRPRPRPAPGQEPDRQARPSSARSSGAQRPAASRAAPARAP